MWTLKTNDATNELRQQRLTDLEKEPVVAGVVVVEGKSRITFSLLRAPLLEGWSRE